MLVDTIVKTERKNGKSEKKANKNKTVKPAPKDKKKAAKKPPKDNVSKTSSFSGGSSGSASSGSGSGGAPFGSMITLCLTILCIFSGIASAAPSNSSSLLSQFATVSKDLGDISPITLKLDGLLKLKGDLNTLIGGKQAIESAIGEVKDQKEQDRLKMWTPENLAALQKNLATAKAVSDVVSKNKIVGNMTDFKAPFEKASEVQGCSIDIKRLASSLKGMIKDQTVATSLEASKNLDLQFVKYDQTRVGGVITGLQSYFDSIFGIKNTKTCDPGSSSCDAAPESSKLARFLLFLLQPIAARPNAHPGCVKNVPSRAPKLLKRKDEIMKGITHEDTVVKAEINFMTNQNCWKRLATVPEALTQEMKSKDSSQERQSTKLVSYEIVSLKTSQSTKTVRLRPEGCSSTKTSRPAEELALLVM
ncbi:unnamed protein product [Caenorhabditis brenneri]